MISITKLVLVGFPNTGKTTLFNQLTGTRYKIGNWSGVTVREHKASFEVQNGQYELIDVPGILSVFDALDQTDCQVCRQAVEKADVLINIVDGRYLHRDLVLTLQLICYEKPILIIVTHEDEMTLEVSKLAQVLPCKCLLASKVSLKDILEQSLLAKSVDISGLMEWPIGFLIESEKGTLASRLQKRLLEDDQADIQIAEGFYQTAAVLIDRYGCREPNAQAESWYEQWVLHPIYGVLIFLFIIYSMFSVTVGLGGAIGDLLSGMVVLIFELLPQNGFAQILLYSAGLGVATCIGFLPILGVMYIFIGYLEQSGYLSRVVLLTDGLMKPIGLSGHSFIPLILGFGCNIPAVMATRVISGENNRILTALMVPFMSCSARLTIFAIFAAAFFPKYGALVVMTLYVLSIFLGIMTILMLQYIFQFKGSSRLSVSLPNYQKPVFSEIIRSVFLKLKGFMRENFKMIVLFSILMGALGRVDQDFSVVHMQYSILAKVGRYVSQYLGFMGISEENWPATVALFSGILAKEVVIVTLNSLYQVAEVASDHFWVQMVDLWVAFGDRLLYFPLQFFCIDSGEVGTHQLYQSYFTTRSALSYMVFILLYFPCLSTMVVLKNEFSLGVSVFSFVWSSLLAIWFAKMTYWGMGLMDVFYLLLIFVTMRAARYYYDTLKG